mmetsp:Transcript_22970/g.59072  ORF Transcript_22970/g.59072 Transcript_22970/m.59072 type:complete len:215 (-) Transcript_22970:391-1035(-)
MSSSIIMAAFSLTTPAPAPLLDVTGAAPSPAVGPDASPLSIDSVILTSSPGLKGGMPRYGQPSHRNASPRPHEPQLDLGGGSLLAAASCISLSPHEQLAHACLRVCGVHLSAPARSGSAASGASSSSSSSISSAPLPAPAAAAACAHASVASAWGSAAARSLRERNDTDAPVAYAGLVARTGGAAERTCASARSASAASSCPSPICALIEASAG